MDADKVKNIIEIEQEILDSFYFLNLKSDPEFTMRTLWLLNITKFQSSIDTKKGEDIERLYNVLFKNDNIRSIEIRLSIKNSEELTIRKYIDILMKPIERVELLTDSKLTHVYFYRKHYEWCIKSSEFKIRKTTKSKLEIDDYLTDNVRIYFKIQL